MPVMKKLIFTLTLLLGATLLINADRLQNHTEQSKVYICNSQDATKYHLTTSCQGLNACKHEIIKVTKEEAYDKGKKTLCGWED
jgi:hypothetical protein